ncbi:MAG: hypothetical protein ACXW18_07430 [Pyrinomonadaceae bacterium]
MAMYDEPQGTSNPYVVTVQYSNEGISQVVTVDGGQEMFMWERIEVWVLRLSIRTGQCVYARLAITKVVF